MTKSELRCKTDKRIAVTRDALQLIWDNTNKGQRSKLLKNEQIKELLERYNVAAE